LLGERLQHRQQVDGSSDPKVAHAKTRSWPIQWPWQTMIGWNAEGLLQALPGLA